MAEDVNTKGTQSESPHPTAKDKEPGVSRDSQTSRDDRRIILRPGILQPFFFSPFLREQVGCQAVTWVCCR